jgi:hypothetical protein
VKSATRADAMITLRFLPIFTEKFGVFLKNQCYDQLFKQLAVVFEKRQLFRRFAWRKDFKNHNVGFVVPALFYCVIIRRIQLFQHFFT